MIHTMLSSGAEQADDDEDYEYDEEEQGSEDEAREAEKEYSRRWHSLSDAVEEEPEKEFSYEPGPPEEGVYGMAIASMILDYRNYVHAKGEPGRAVRYSCRLALALTLTLFTLGLQGYLTIMTKKIVTPPAVRALRQGYSDYQMVMYDGHTNLTVHGNHRGVKGFLNLSNFHNLGEDQKETICTCPLAQPQFLGAILLIWTITCLAYMRQNVTFTSRLWALKNVPSMGSKGVLQAQTTDGQETGKYIVMGVPLPFKVLMIALIQLPCLAMNVLLLWIGCRWLVATMGFGELLLNAIALEFVLNLSCLIFKAVVPLTMQISLSNILVKHTATSEKPNWWNMLSTFLLFICAILFVYLYLHVFQQVLPDFNWDIAEACDIFMEKAAFV